jgi:hypothetical protein
MNKRIGLDELHVGMLVTALEGSDGEVVLRFSKKFLIWTTNDIERFRRAGCTMALVDLHGESRPLVPAPPAPPAPLFRPVRGVYSPFSEMDAGSSALSRAAVGSGSMAAVVAGEALSGEIIEDFVELAPPEVWRAAALVESGAEKKAAAPTVAREKKEKKEYSIDAEETRSLNLHRRYARKRPVILSWKKGDAKGGASSSADAGHPVEGKSSFYGDEIIELSDVVAD